MKNMHEYQKRKEQSRFYFPICLKVSCAVCVLVALSGGGGYG